MSEYQTYTMGAENFEIAPEVRQIRPIKVEGNQFGYVITYAIPVELLPDPEGEC